MAHYPTSATGLAATSSPVGPTASGTTVTAGSANVKGSYVEFVASLGFTANRVTILVLATIVAAPRQYLIDLATGAAGSESVVVPNLMTEGSPSSGASPHGELHVALPLAVASGTRIALRCACSTASDTIGQLSVTCAAAGGTPGCTAFVNAGADTSDSGGTAVDPGGTANTKGSYTQLTASTGAVAQVLVPLATVRGNAAATTAQWAFDVATGAGGAETVLVPDIRLGTAGAAEVRLNLRAVPPLLTYIASGTRIAVRASCDITDATDRLLDAAVLIATAPAA
jgi:hypothetical protein